MRIVFVTVLAALVGLSTPAAAQDSPPRTLTVTGSGSFEAAPDMALIRLGVTTQAKEAAAAMAKNTEQMTAMIETLKAAGIAPGDLQTSNLSLHPNWSSRNSSSSQPPRILGFVARNTLAVRVRDLARLGQVLDAVIKAGANDFQGLSFSLSDPTPAADAARSDAVADATRKARLYAKAAGVALGPVLSISETAGARPYAAEMARAAMADAVPIEAGEVSVGASVTIVYAIE
ncbi:MAG: SIMPL domain-containing protein [Brevirhabdus sp.]